MAQQNIPRVNARRTLAVPPVVDEFFVNLARERGCDVTEIYRQAMFDFMERRLKLVPRKRPLKGPPREQTAIPLDSPRKRGQARVTGPSWLEEPAVTANDS